MRYAVHNTSSKYINHRIMFDKGSQNISAFRKYYNTVKVTLCW